MVLLGKKMKWCWMLALALALALATSSASAISEERDEVVAAAQVTAAETAQQQQEQQQQQQESQQVLDVQGFVCSMLRLLCVAVHDSDTTSRSANLRRTSSRATRTTFSRSFADQTRRLLIMQWATQCARSRKRERRKKSLMR